MKCSEYLWKYLSLHKDMGDITDNEVQGQIRVAMRQNGDTTIISNTTGNPMQEDDALSVLGRATTKSGRNRLIEAFKAGQKSLFEQLVTNQNMSDDEYHAAKEAAEKETAEKAEAENDG